MAKDGVNSDLAGKDHWDSLYDTASICRERWQPSTYDERVLEHFLAKEAMASKAKSILEVGCGNSRWLGYLGKRFKCDTVAGIDYSDSGVALAQAQLDSEGIKGCIHRMDFFDASENDVGQFDFVYSLGVVEHFEDLNNVIATLLRFVRPGGVLFTEVPNLQYLHGVLARIYQPSLLAKHQVVTRRALFDSYVVNGLMDVRTKYIGLCSTGIVAWGHEPRFPQLDRWILPIANAATKTSNCILNLGSCFLGVPWTSPFVIAMGRKK